jgi:hypothetical protein
MFESQSKSDGLSIRSFAFLSLLSKDNGKPSAKAALRPEPACASRMGLSAGLTTISGFSFQRCHPVPGKHFVDPANRMVRQMCEDMTQIGKGIKAIHLC